MKKDYNSLIKKETKAFDDQARKRFLNGLLPDVRNLGKNKFFYNNPYREQEIYDIQWGPRIKDVITLPINFSSISQVFKSHPPK